MYFLYLILGYLSIRPITSYVLLAANVEDFRSLAERLAPEHLADQILSIITAPRDTAKYEESEDSSETTEEKVVDKNRQKHIQRGANVKKPGKSSTAAYEIQLDDLVARVKERLQKELMVMATSKDGLKYTPEPDNDYVAAETAKKRPIASKPHANKGAHSHSGKKPQVRYVQQSRDDGKHQEKDRVVGHERYAEPQITDEQNFESPIPTSKYLEQGHIAPKPKRVRPKRYKQRIIKDRIPQQKKVTQSEYATEDETPKMVTEDILNLFKEENMFGKNDSYEDYVTPKRDDDYIEPETQNYNTEQTNVNFEMFTDELPAKESNFDKKEDYISDAEKTINYNKKRTTRSVDDVRTTHKKLRIIERPSDGRIAPVRNLKRRQPRIRRPKVLQPIRPTTTTENPDLPMPYAEQIAEAVYDDDEPRVTQTDEVKARTESLLFEENAAAPVHPPTLTYNITNPNLLYKHKNKKVQKAGTVIPKRDFYKMSSPNYVAQLPKVAESYKFDEPLPEKDREPEDLKPIGNPPASINGKVKLI